MNVKVFIVNPFPIVRYGLIQLLKNELDATICGATDSAREARDAIAESNPDLLIVSLSLNEGNGVQLIKEARSLLPNMPILALSTQEETMFAERVLRAGGNGYLMLREEPEKMVEAVKVLLRGDIYLSPEMGRRLTQLLSASQRPYIRPRIPKGKLERLRAATENQEWTADKE